MGDESSMSIARIVDNKEPVLEILVVLEVAAHLVQTDYL